jgi:hypothetical protein
MPPKYFIENKKFALTYIIYIERRELMSKWNKESAPNNNLSADDIKNSQSQTEHEFSEELSDGMERNKYIKDQQSKKIK